MERRLGIDSERGKESKISTKIKSQSYKISRKRSEFDPILLENLDI